ncbi:hypothetical protein EXN66_Car005648 [Channa argus]|uniref:Secreted protein n=1 Tax=Channa argus TaxID=215402 RepID=A0A6G1PIZ3_CHAAH|nr:hypothetical protein EXN66_Car005648 [Channa argus]
MVFLLQLWYFINNATEAVLCATITLHFSVSEVDSWQQDIFLVRSESFINVSTHFVSVPWGLRVVSCYILTTLSC